MRLGIDFCPRAVLQARRINPVSGCSDLTAVYRSSAAVPALRTLMVTTFPIAESEVVLGSFPAT